MQCIGDYLEGGFEDCLLTPSEFSLIMDEFASHFFSVYLSNDFEPIFTQNERINVVFLQEDN